MSMLIKFVPTDSSTAPGRSGKLADAEVHFFDGPLAGLKLVGFGVWQRRSATGYNVTFPARQYSLNGERRSFALLRPILDATAQEPLRAAILDAYVTFAQDFAEAV
jgi:hypothetical protein